jgi:outer membrane receptor protein involved in Fe transport
MRYTDVRCWSFVATSILLFAASSALAQSTYRFDIPAQPLDSALIEFAQVAGIELGFESKPDERARSAGLTGAYTIRDGLTELLRGTGTSFTRIAPRAYRVHEAAPAPAASGGAAGSAAEITPVAKSLAMPGRQEPLPGLDEIVAIGTRIRESGYRLVQPVTVVDGDFARQAAVYSAGGLFDYVPLSGANTFNGIDNYFYGVNDARGDVATANLRGLGGGNSLVLLNGRRIVNHPGTQAENRVVATTVNLNTLPLFALERVEVLHDGASSVHGSDAVAGVVNAVVNTDDDRTRFGLMHGLSEDGAIARTTAHFQVSRPLAEFGHVALFAELSDEGGLEASERRFSMSSDLRPFFADTAFAGDNDLDNRSRSTPWGQFKLPVGVSQNGDPVTTDMGLWHVQPANLPGCTTSLGSDLCIDDGLLDRALRFDSNRYRYLAPDIERINLFSMWSAALSDTAEMYGEIGWVRSRSRHTREPANPLSSHPITIPRDNYWNPFGPLVFDDGRPNPNRLPGIDAPAEGLPVSINTRGLGGFYKLADAGPRIIDVENRVDRWLIGARGWLGAWSIDTAYLYSGASTRDVTGNRVSSTLFQESLSRDTPDAYNPFNGGDPADPGFGDGTPNPAAVVDAFLVDVWRRNRTTLSLWDLAISRPDALRFSGRPVGISIGGEIRRETFEERRDPRLNGEIGYTDRVTGIAYTSDVMGSSITPDFRGSRTVRSLFGEVAISLVDETANLPMIRRLDANIAMRLESYSDIGTEWRPRLGVGWWLDDQWALHASWSEGLRAPNLAQVNASAVPRIQVVRDWYRCQALINKGVFDSLGECEIEAARAVEVVTSGSSDLEAETNRSLSVGLRFRPSDDGGLSLSADYWRIEQRDVVGIFGDQNQVALDYFARLGGGENPAVTRAPLRPEDLLQFEGSGLDPVGLLVSIDDPYLNLDRRVTEGVDMAVAFRMAPQPFGTLNVDLQTTRLLTARQSVPEPGQPIVEAGEPAIPFVGAGDLLQRNGRPKWRASLRLAIERDTTSFGVVANYVGDVIDTSTIQDDTSAFLPVDDWGTMTAFAGIDLRLFGDVDAALRFSVGNVFDTAPPIADEDLGYFVGLHDALGRTWNLSVSAEL